MEEDGIYNGTYHFLGDTIYNYVNDKYMTAYGPGFFTGGQDKGHTNRTTITRNFKASFNWQMTNSHSIKSGVSLIKYDLQNTYHSIRNAFSGTSLESTQYKPIVLPDSTVYSDVFSVKPKEMSFFIQDKFEREEIVLNLV